jgi:hypothetical protein
LIDVRDDADGICDNCGAAKLTGRATCKYCGRPFVADLQARAVPCPSCKTYNDWGVVQCVQCNAHVVVVCVFCNSISPHHLTACLRCREPFAGAPERLAARKAEADRAKTLETVATVGTVAATVLGVAAGGRRRRARGAARLLKKGIESLIDDDD